MGGAQYAAFVQGSLKLRSTMICVYGGIDRIFENDHQQ